MFCTIDMCWNARRFVNRDDLDFATAQELEALQEFSLNEDFRGELEYPTRRAITLSELPALNPHLSATYGDHGHWLSQCNVTLWSLFQT